MQLQIVNICLAIVTMTVGLGSYYCSDWSGMSVNHGGFNVELKLYMMCSKWGYRGGNDEINESTFCPNIALERCFSAVIIICFIGSLLSLLLMPTRENGIQKYGAIILNFLMAFLLFVGAVSYIVSAEQIHHLRPGAYLNKNLFVPAREPRGYKISAGILAIIQSVLFMTVAVKHSRTQ